MGLIQRRCLFEPAFGLSEPAQPLSLMEQAVCAQADIQEGKGDSGAGLLPSATEDTYTPYSTGRL